MQFGEGGEDSKIFVHELFAAYAKYAEARHLETTIIESTEGSITACLKGHNAGRYFANEAGQHVCQRVPPTETRGRRHTSLVRVSVMPMPDNSVALIPEKDIEVMTMRGTGAGGQHKNKTDSAVKMVHKPTKISAYCDGRDQHQNRRDARRVLTARVTEHYRGQKQSAYDSVRKAQLGTGNRGERIRTYNFMRGESVDHRTDRRADVWQVISKGRFELLE